MSDFATIESIGRRIGQHLGLPHAFRVEDGMLFVRYSDLDLLEQQIGKAATDALVHEAPFIETDKGLCWEVM